MSISGCNEESTFNLTADDNVNVPSFTSRPAELIGSPCGAIRSVTNSIPKSVPPDGYVVIVVSTSSFARYLSLYSRDCDEIYMPNVSQQESHYLVDKSITYVQYESQLDLEKWKNDITYRLQWVSDG